MIKPPIELVRQNDTHRLIPSKYSDGGDSVLTRIADDDAHLQDIFELDHATNDRLLAENDRALEIGRDELVFAIPCHRIINAAFCHPDPLGARFSGPRRGAWSAAFALETAQAEVTFHKTLALSEIDWFEEDVTYDDYLADFSATFHDLRGDRRFSECLAPDSYVASQGLAEHLLDRGALGVVYPSVRDPAGTCLACFRPALVGNVRKAATVRFVWTGTPTPTIHAL